MNERPATESLQVRISKDCISEINFRGTVTQEAISNLREFLKTIANNYPDTSKDTQIQCGVIIPSTVEHYLIMKGWIKSSCFSNKPSDQWENSRGVYPNYLTSFSVVIPKKDTDSWNIELSGVLKVISNFEVRAPEDILGDLLAIQEKIASRETS